MIRSLLRSMVGAAIISCATAILAQDAPEDALALPAHGYHSLRILSPDLLEVTVVETKQPDPAPLHWLNFVNANGQFDTPAASKFTVTAGGQPIAVRSTSFKRRPLYAPLRERDLRVASSLYLQLAGTIPSDAPVEVKTAPGEWWPKDWTFTATMKPLRFNPALHVNQTGYEPAFPKRAMVGYYLGSAGEMAVGTNAGFRLVESGTGTEVFQSSLRARRDVGYAYTPLPYQQVYEADFSSFNTPGEYRLVVPGMGTSFPFLIDDGVAMNIARAYALGLYHQRCGMANELPFTRHTHGPCHTAPAEIPTMAQTNTQFFISQFTVDYTNYPRHTAPQLKNVDTSLYPFVNHGKVDVSGGHHDAGDYSKYTVNSALLIHLLVFGADSFAGAGELDNLGLPESGDGKSDLLQEAKWEADFLAKMQDADGGFYFLVYPRKRAYENNVLPDAGDPQVVWPKNTTSTAAAVAALAQCASSPRFKQQFPEAAAAYLQHARRGWSFLTNAIARHGRDGAWQKITHYGNEFMHDDELAWAACEMFLATGDDAYHRQLLQWFPNPGDPATTRWGWWRLFAAYGCAIRSYAFGAASGRVPLAKLEPRYLRQCEAQILAVGNDSLKWSQQCAYGSSMPEQTKRVRGAGWYFSSGPAYDLATAYQLSEPPLNDPRPRFLDAILANLNYEGGCNPVNVTYVTGLGTHRQREIVHQYAQNDRRILPPTGIPIGNIQASFDYLAPYKSELGVLCFPSDGANIAPYPFYDRWGDSFNLGTEFVITDQGRALATAAFLAAMTPLKKQPWKQPSIQITGLPAKAPLNNPVKLTITSPGASLDHAQIVWETPGAEPAMGAHFTFRPATNGVQWIETEVTWPDGRRAFAVTNLTVGGH